ncbi:hypothetical protein E0N24_26905 [Escherichia coli]|nr:hypothetical protein [Escherichia coli]RZW25981.1 hypothetical protein EXX78_25245 [Escherichia coli]
MNSGLKFLLFIYALYCSEVSISPLFRWPNSVNHYNNELHPHIALSYRLPRKYMRRHSSNGLSDNRHLEI